MIGKWIDNVWFADNIELNTRRLEGLETIFDIIINTRKALVPTINIQEPNVMDLAKWHSIETSWKV